MSLTKVVSDIYKIDSPIHDVYALLSDFNRMGKLFEMAKAMGMFNDSQFAKISEKIEHVSFSEDACFLTVRNLGEVVIKIVEREEPKLIKLGGEGALPLEFNLWLQFLENAPYDTRMKITFQGDLNVMLKMLVKGKLEKGINQLAEGLTKIPYRLLVNRTM